VRKSPPEIAELDELTPEAVRAMYVDRFGARCAAWLVNRFRRQVKRSGAFQLQLGPGHDLPPWADIAITFLRDRRTSKWSVARRVHRGTRYWTFVWKLGATAPRDLPIALQRV